MKCDELTIYHSKNLGLPVYLKSEVDEAIAELKATCVHTDNSAIIESMAAELEKLRPMETALELAEADNRGYLARIKELEAKLEDTKATAYAESVDAGMRERRLKRALWLARAKRATEKADSFIDIKVTYHGVCNINHSVYPQKNAKRMLTCDEWLDVWTNVWDKCRAKAKEYL